MGKCITERKKNWQGIRTTNALAAGVGAALAGVSARVYLSNLRGKGGVQSCAAVLDDGVSSPRMNLEA